MGGQMGGQTGIDKARSNSMKRTANSCKQFDRKMDGRVYKQIDANWFVRVCLCLYIKYCKVTWQFSRTLVMRHIGSVAKWSSGLTWAWCPRTSYHFVSLRITSYHFVSLRITSYPPVLDKVIDTFRFYQSQALQAFNRCCLIQLRLCGSWFAEAIRCPGQRWSLAVIPNIWIQLNTNVLSAACAALSCQALIDVG